MIVKPGYLKLTEKQLAKRIDAAQHLMKACSGCARNCNVDRSAGQLGQCQTGIWARVASYGPHMGEEDPLRGWLGSGTIFFGSCNLHCVYCQNFDISQRNAGQAVSAEELAAVMLKLQDMGCHNINLVSPSHVGAQILEALSIAVQQGLHLPLVYNTGGYDSLEMLTLLDGIVDIYMPDMKYADAQIGKSLSGIIDYPKHNQNAVREMHRQVGNLLINENGLAVKGLLVRHLVLPENLAGSSEIMRFLAEEISKDTYINIMSQYYPAWHAYDHPQLKRRITQTEYKQAVETARSFGLYRFDKE